MSTLWRKKVRERFFFLLHLQPKFKIFSHPPCNWKLKRKNLINFWCEVKVGVKWKCDDDDTDDSDSNDDNNSDNNDSDDNDDDENCFGQFAPLVLIEEDKNCFSEEKKIFNRNKEKKKSFSKILEESVKAAISTLSSFAAEMKEIKKWEAFNSQSANNLQNCN